MGRPADECRAVAPKLMYFGTHPFGYVHNRCFTMNFFEKCFAKTHWLFNYRETVRGIPPPQKEENGRAGKTKNGQHEKTQVAYDSLMYTPLASLQKTRKVSKVIEIIKVIESDRGEKKVIETLKVIENDG